MDSNFLRALDRWIGVPACLLVGLWLRLTGRYRAPSGVPRPRRIVFIALAEIGALFVANSAVVHARKRFPDAELYFLTFEAGRSAAEMLGFEPRHVITLRPASLPSLAWTMLVAIGACRRAKIDASVNLEVYVRFSTLLAALSGARWRAGFHGFHDAGASLGGLVTQRAVYSPHHHAAVSYMLLVEALAESPDAEPRAKIPAKTLPLSPLQLSSTEQSREHIRDIVHDALPTPAPSLGRLVILNANASDLVPVRRWPQARYVNLAQRLLERPDVIIVLTGTAAERPGATALAEAIASPRVANLAGRTTLRELIDLFTFADLMVTNDSGPAHFAGATELKTIVLFGPETPRIFGPLGRNQVAIYKGLGCSPCVSVYNRKRSPCGDNRCLTSIGVEQVFEAAERLLNGESLEREAVRQGCWPSELDK